MPRRPASSDVDNDIDLEPDQLGGDFGEALAASLRPAILDRDVATFDPAEVAQPLHKSGGPLAGSEGVVVPRNPMVGSFPGCCARAASGHAPQRRRAWLRISVVRCGLPSDPSGWGSFMQWRGGYHALAKDERCFCAAKVGSRPGLLWVKSGKARTEHIPSGLLPKADIVDAFWHFRFVPTTDKCGAAKL